MDHLLRPDKLETLLEDPDAAKVFEYWFKTSKVFYLLLQVLLITNELSIDSPC